MAFICKTGWRLGLGLGSGSELGLGLAFHPCTDKGHIFTDKGLTVVRLHISSCDCRSVIVSNRILFASDAKWSRCVCQTKESCTFQQCDGDISVPCGAVWLAATYRCRWPGQYVSVSVWSLQQNIGHWKLFVTHRLWLCMTYRLGGKVSDCFRSYLHQQFVRCINSKSIPSVILGLHWVLV